MHRFTCGTRRDRVRLETRWESSDRAQCSFCHGPAWTVVDTLYYAMDCTHFECVKDVSKSRGHLATFLVVRVQITVMHIFLVAKDKGTTTTVLSILHSPPFLAKGLTIFIAFRGGMKSRQVERRERRYLPGVGKTRSRSRRGNKRWFLWASF